MDTDNTETFVGVNTENKAMSSKASKGDQNSHEGLDKTQHVSVSLYRSKIVQLFEIGKILVSDTFNFVLFGSVLLCRTHEVSKIFQLFFRMKPN